MNTQSIKINIGTKEAALVNRNKELHGVDFIHQENIISGKALISLESQIAPSVEQMNLNEKETSLPFKKEQEKKSNISICKSKCMDVSIQNELDSETSFLPVVLKEKNVCIDLIHQKPLVVETSQSNIKEKHFTSDDVKTNICQTDIISNQSTVVSETFSSTKENELKIQKPIESHANIEQLNKKSVEISEEIPLDTIKEFDKSDELIENASMNLVATENILNIQQNIVNENEKIKLSDKPKKKKLSISVMSKEAVIVKQLDSCQQEKEFEKSKSPKTEIVEQNFVLEKAKQISKIESFGVLEPFKSAQVEKKNVEITLSTNKTVNVSETEVLNKESVKSEEKPLCNHIEPKLIESSALEVCQTEEQFNKREFIVTTKLPVEAHSKLVPKYSVSKSSEQLYEKESNLKEQVPKLSEVSQSMIPSFSLNVYFDEPKEKETKLNKKTLNVKNAIKKSVTKKQNSLEVQDILSTEQVKTFESKPLEKQQAGLKLEEIESISVSLQQPNDKEQVVELKKPKFEAAKKRFEFRKSKSLAVQKAESLEKENQFIVQKPKLAETKEKFETFNSSTQEQYYSLDSVDDFVSEPISLKTGNLSIEKYLPNEIDHIQPDEQIDKLNDFVKPKEHVARECMVDELKTAKLNEVPDSIQSVEEFEDKLDENKLKINLKKSKKVDVDEKIETEQKTEIKVKTIKKKIVTEEGKEEEVEEIIPEEQSDDLEFRKIIVESIQNEVDIKIIPKQDLELDSKKADKISKISYEKTDEIETDKKVITLKPTKVEKSETFTEAKTKVTCETKKKISPEEKKKSEVETSVAEKSEVFLSSKKEIDKIDFEIELVQNTEIDFKSKKKPRFVERFDMKPGKTEPVYNIAKEQSTSELYSEKIDELDQPRELEKHASTSIENLKTVGVDLIKTEERETELKPKQKKRVKIIIPTKEARQLNEVDQSMTAAEIKPDRYYEGIILFETFKNK